MGRGKGGLRKKKEGTGPMEESLGILTTEVIHFAKAKGADIEPLENSTAPSTA